MLNITTKYISTYNNSAKFKHIIFYNFREATLEKNNLKKCQDKLISTASNFSKVISIYLNQIKWLYCNSIFIFTLYTTLIIKITTLQSYYLVILLITK